MRGLTIGLLALLGCGIANAQPAPGGDPLAAFGFHIVKPMTPEETAALRSVVDSVLAKAGPPGTFENVTDANGGAGRHIASGLTCALGKPGQSMLLEAPNAVSCHFTGSDGVTDIRIVPAPPRATLDSVAADALRKARKEPRFAPYTGLSVSSHPTPGSGLPDHRTIRFTSLVDGVDRFSRLQIGIINGWLFTDRATGRNPPEKQTGMSEMNSEMMFGWNMKSARPAPR
jgi:hypothetical protein